MSERSQRDQFGSARDRGVDLREYPPGLRAAIAGLMRLGKAFAGPRRPPLPPSVEAALHDVEAAFGDARLSQSFDACPHCYTDADITYLRTVPPAAMSESDIARIVFSLRSTIGDADDIAYFVPAMVRAHVSGAVVEDALVMKHLGCIPPPHWTAARRDALRAAYAAYFAWISAEEKCPMDLTDAAYRAWSVEMLERPPHAEPFERPIPAGMRYDGATRCRMSEMRFAGNRR